MKLEGIEAALLKDEETMQMHTCARKPSAVYEFASRKSEVIVVEIIYDMLDNLCWKLWKRHSRASTIDK